MSQATALLNSLSGDMPATYSDNSGELIIVDDNRFITVPESLKRLGVQYDHNIETVTIQCPRYWDDHDMSKMSIYINCMLPDSTKVQYNAKNISPSGRRMTFDWTIDNNLTQKSGTISFLICICKTDSEGNEERHWNSELNQECYISGGLECSETILNQYPAIITDLLTRMEEVEALATPASMEAYVSAWLAENHSTAIAELEAKGAEVLASIPTDYAETHALAKDAARTKADAIICAAQGEVIYVDDASDDCLHSLRIFGKTKQLTTTGAQLFDGTKISDLTGNGVTMDNDGYGRITLAGRSTSYVSSVNVRIEGLAPGTYYASGEISGKIYFYVRLTLADGTYKYIKSPAAFTLDGTETEVLGYLYAPTSGVTFNRETICPMLNAGDVPLPWEYYTGRYSSPSPDWPQELDRAENTTIKFCGKNLLNLPQVINETSTLYNYDLFTGANGAGQTIPSTYFKTLPVLKAGVNYYFSYDIDEDNVSKLVFLQKVASDGATNMAGVLLDTEGTVCVSEDTMVTVRANSNVPYTLRNVQLEIGTQRTEYEAYKESNSLLSAHVLSRTPTAFDEIDYARGVHIQRVGVLTLDGSADEIWYEETAMDNTVMYRIGISDSVNVGNVAGRDFICDRFSVGQIYNTDTVGAQHTMSQFYFRIAKSKLETVDMTGFKYWLSDNPVTILYELATPIETVLTVEEVAAYEALRTSYPNTVIMNDAGAEMALKYHADTETFITNLIDSVSVKSAMITLPANKWVEVESGYAQAISLSGVTPNSKIDLHPTPAQLASLIEEEISLMACNDNGAVTIYSVGTSPTFDIVMQVQITEVVPV